MTASMRVMTDVSSERYWMVVSEMEVDSPQQDADMVQKSIQRPEFQEVMKGCHDLNDPGGREIYQLEK
jgi:hypothetical protein